MGPSTLPAGDLIKDNINIKSTISNYKIEQWANNFKTMQKEQKNVQKGLKIGYKRYCSKDKVRRAY